MQCFEKENGGVFVDRNDRNRIPLISGKNSRKRLFTLIELFIVIAIIAILVGMLLPALNKARESARGIGCLSKLKHINVTSAFYSSDNKEYELSCATSIDTYAKDCTWKNFISINYMLKNENLLLGNKYFICPSDDAPAKDYYMPSSLGSYGYTTLTGNMREVYIGLNTEQEISTGYGNIVYIMLQADYLGPKRLICGIGNRIRKITLLADDSSIAFRQEADKVYLIGLPFKETDELPRILKIELDGLPVGIHNPMWPENDFRIC